MLWGVFFEERRSIDPIWESLERDGPVLDMGNHDFGNACVVIDHLALGEAALWVQNLLEIRHRKLSTVNRCLDSLRTHGRPRLRSCPAEVLARMDGADGHHSSTH